jgi:hypothetical protein
MQQRHRTSLQSTNIATAADGVVEGIVELTAAPLNTNTLDALVGIRTTPFGRSFLSRLHGNHVHTPGLIYVDWETKTPWMNLMEDIREHHQFLQ